VRCSVHNLKVGADQGYAVLNTITDGYIIVSGNLIVSGR
jgi:hypothetical protein